MEFDMRPKILGFFLFFFLPVVSCYALPVTEKDVFSPGDKLGFHEYETGLDWLDLDVDETQTLEALEFQLQDMYMGWRLPTQAEILHLFSAIFPVPFVDLNHTLHLNQGLFTEQITTHRFFPEIEAALNIMNSSEPIAYRENGTQYRRFFNQYLDDNSNLVMSSITIYTTLYDCAHCNPANRYFYETEVFVSPVDLSGEPIRGSFYLVRHVSEPGSVSIILIGLCSLILKRRFRGERIFSSGLELALKYV
jgi:hypothetical protein